MTQHDIVLVGGGLQGCLCVLALAHERPSARVVLIEAGSALGGNHTWCFHAGDAAAGAHAWIDPAIAHRWDGYDVAFAEHERRLASPYAAISSESLDLAVRAAIASHPTFTLLTDVTATTIETTRVVLADGRELHAPLVVDARGPDRYAVTGAVGYQKFVGLELELAAPHGLTRPLLMDARVSQANGFRFVYLLPFSPTRLLVEDTYYAESPTLDHAAITSEVLAYARSHFPDAGELTIVRREHGVLPLPLEPRASVPTALGAGPLEAGYQGGWFHPTTGYSFPIALRIAAFVAMADHPDAAALWGELGAQHRDQVAFALRLNRMLFHWFAPAQRHHVLARFYRLPADTIARFYALTTTHLDRARVVLGRPPRGMSWRALLTGRKAWALA